MLMSRNSRIGVMLSEAGRAYIETVAREHDVYLSDVIRVALVMAGEQPREFEKRVAQVRTRF